MELPQKIYLTRSLSGSLYPGWEIEPSGAMRKSFSYVLEPKWIPVEDGLPKESIWELYQVTYVNENQKLATEFARYKPRKSQWRWFSVYGSEFESDYGKVIAWQPIQLDDPYIPKDK